MVPCGDIKAAFACVFAGVLLQHSDRLSHLGNIFGRPYPKVWCEFWNFNYPNTVYLSVNFLFNRCLYFCYNLCSPSEIIGAFKIKKETIIFMSKIIVFSQYRLCSLNGNVGAASDSRNLSDKKCKKAGDDDFGYHIGGVIYYGVNQCERSAGIRIQNSGSEIAEF